MEVFHPNDTFQFEHLYLTPPMSVAGGTYMTRYSYFNSKQPLYIQTTKTRTKQGIVISGKKGHIDLLITNSDTDSDFTEWIANLEKRSVDLLYEKRHMWFTQELDRTDIENSFTSPIRAYKTGNFLVRVNLEPNRNFTHIQPFSCKVFDEHKKVAPVEYIKDEHTIISIIEFQGIKFTSRNFQMELLLRQVLVVPDIPLFETCIISESVPGNSNTSNTELEKATTKQDEPGQQQKSEDNNDYLKEEPLTSLLPHPYSDPVQETETKYLGCNSETDTNLQTAAIKHFGVTEVEINFDTIPDTIDTNEPNFPSSTTDTTVTSISSSNQPTMIASIKLKKHKDVLYGMYKIAKKKAIEAKKVAIRTYLEAKEIKAAYLLDDSDLSESDGDDDNNV